MPSPKRPPRKHPLARLRAICLALADTHEKIAWGAPTFRVRDRLFVMYADTHHGDGRVAIWCKATFIEQDLMVRSDPRRFFVPPYVGPYGWVGVRLDLRPNWQIVSDVIDAAYRLAAAKPRGAASKKRRRDADPG